MKYFSHSRIQTYRQCPAKFQFRYIQKIDKVDEGIEAFMGKRVHEALEFLYNQVLLSCIPLLDTVINHYRLRWETSRHDRIGIVYRKLRAEDYLNLGESCIAWYYRTNHPFNQPVVATEKPVTFSLNPVGGPIFKGIIDRLDHDRAGHWEIHDYKTGKRAFSQAGADRDGQLALYHLALLRLGEPVKKVTLIWHFLQRRQVVSSYRSKPQITIMVSHLNRICDEILERITRELEFKTVESPLCNWCYYWEECPLKEGTNPFVPA